MCDFFFSSRRRHTRYWRDWSSDVCSSDLWLTFGGAGARSEAKLAATYPAQGVGDLQAFLVEILITFILVFVVMAVATDERAPAAIAPIAAGFALAVGVFIARSEEHTSELQSRQYLVCRLLLEKKNTTHRPYL